ncbi:hypothetical protein APR40_05230 [Salegentibacter salarius]|uniref:Lipopolysaccharide assembly protein A domain-containing protein n=1 Tax=Salegentibacter salarius TaxID=435906 RepID=A0A2N0TNK4_9FLAO|nr:hypothetical protein BHS39_05230 [Salegentibacter salarius]PKD16323.1 hypothetical protein APR40_05230 [Salegentibacter salarius]SLJ90087.1 Protein of unknown function [Salegentibacter salarius]
MRFVKSILLILLIAAAIIFAFQNLETVNLAFLSWHLELPLSFLSILLYILGAVSGGLLFSILKRLATDRNNNTQL